VAAAARATAAAGSSQGLARWRYFSARRMGRMGGGASAAGVFRKCYSRCWARLMRHLW